MDHAKQIEARLDSKTLASVGDPTHVKGMFALGTGWGRVQFDDLSITRD